jgi:hypothetical protein
VIAQDRHHKSLLEPAALHRSAAHDVLFGDGVEGARTRDHTLAAPIRKGREVVGALTLVGVADDVPALAGLAETLELQAARISQNLESGDR